MIEIILTKHAKIRFQQRKIDVDLVEKAVTAPDLTLPGMFGRKLARLKVGDKILEVVFVKDGEKVIVVTAYFLN